jgi:hypothetical protein
MTGNEIKAALADNVGMQTIFNALDAIPGVTHNGERLKKERVYELNPMIPGLDTDPHVPEKT